MLEVWLTQVSVKLLALLMTGSAGAIWRWDKTTSVIKFLKMNLVNWLFNKRACAVFTVQTWTCIIESI